MIAVIDGKHCCYTTTNGIKRHYLGCQHDGPRQAIRHVHPVYVSPLRASDEATTPASIPPSGAGSLVASSESLGDSRH